jgi:hypothetical protein
MTFANERHMNSPTDLDDETLTCLRTARNIILNLPRRVPDRNLVIHSLLQSASEAFVWPPPKGSPPRPYPTEFVTPERGRCRLDLSKAAIAGFGPFWHLGERGSIALRTPRLPSNMVAILQDSPLQPGCTAPGIFNRYQLAKGNSPGAIRYCDEVAKCGEIAFLLPRQGTDHLCLFAPEDELPQLFGLALRNCPPWNVNNAYFEISQCYLAKSSQIHDAP